jgi:hypothetical protein
MSRALLAMLCAAVSLSCRGDAERLPPPLPKDGSAVPYRQILTRLSAQANTAKEEHFLSNWDGVVDASAGIENSTAYILKAPDLPILHRSKIEKSSSELHSNAVKLREAARKKDQTESLDLIRRIHNQIHELQEFK